MSNWMKIHHGWETAAKGLLVLWLLIALAQQYPVVLRQGFNDLMKGLSPLPVPSGAAARAPGLQELSGHLKTLDGGRGWHALLILPLPTQFERNLGRFDELNVVGVGGLADDIFRLVYESFPQRLDVAFLDSRGRLTRASYRPAERFVPSVAINLSQYEIVAMPRNTGLALDRMEAVGQTSGGEIVIYKRIHL